MCEDENTLQAYIAGRNASRDGYQLTDCPFNDCEETLLRINWECGWIDYWAENE